MQIMAKLCLGRSVRSGPPCDPDGASSLAAPAGERVQRWHIALSWLQLALSSRPGGHELARAESGHGLAGPRPGCLPSWQSSGQTPQAPSSGRAEGPKDCGWRPGAGVAARLAEPSSRFWRAEAAQGKGTSSCASRPFRDVLAEMEALFLGHAVVLFWYPASRSCEGVTGRCGG